VTNAGGSVPVTNADDSVPVTNADDSVPLTNAGNSMMNAADSAASAIDSATGVDACAGGWVAITLRPPAAADPSAPLTATVAVAPTLDRLQLGGVVGIDMPLGLLEDGWRVADVLARRALGRRGVTVFAIPPRPVWQQPTYAEANKACRELTGKGLSAQTWGLRGKLLEADAYRRASPARLHEVHPELSFAAMAAGAPLAASKHTAAGLVIRRELLAQVGITLPPKVTGAPENDLLDAAAVAWSARRIAAAWAVTLTDPEQRADDGTEIAIRY
jgi:predicted RNase H-like nuclease